MNAPATLPVKMKICPQCRHISHGPAIPKPPICLHQQARRPSLRYITVGLGEPYERMSCEVMRDTLCGREGKLFEPKTSEMEKSA